jgi:hypothetical protein
LLERYLELAPDGAQADLVRQALSGARARAGVSTTASPTPTTAG